MKYKMLVIDMDDTLLADDHKISEENKEMIFKAQEKRGVCYLGFWKTNFGDDCLCQGIENEQFLYDLL